MKAGLGVIPGDPLCSYLPGMCLSMFAFTRGVASFDLSSLDSPVPWGTCDISQDSGRLKVRLDGTWGQPSHL